MDDYPTNLMEFDRRFCSEQACRDYLAQMKWPEGFQCPRCENRQAWITARKLYHCTACGHETSRTAGTIFQDTRKPLMIVIVLDNARYQHCKLVEALAEERGITLPFLPSYSPNPNLIERLWKFVKKKCLYNIYYATFDEFTAGINDCLSRVETDYKPELATLMQPNFQDFKNVNLLAF